MQPREPHDYVWVELYSASGSDAEHWIKIIQKKGALDALMNMLVNLPLDGRKEVTSKPWGLFSDTESLGDYTLVWDTAKNLVWLWEQTDLDDPFANV